MGNIKIPIWITKIIYLRRTQHPPTVDVTIIHLRELSSDFCEATMKKTGSSFWSRQPCEQSNILPRQILRIPRHWGIVEANLSSLLPIFVLPSRSDPSSPFGAQHCLGFCGKLKPPDLYLYCFLQSNPNTTPLLPKINWPYLWGELRQKQMN